MKIFCMVFKLQRGHDFVTDRQPEGRTDDPGKNNMSPNPKKARVEGGGRGRGGAG